MLKVDYCIKQLAQERMGAIWSSAGLWSWHLGGAFGGELEGRRRLVCFCELL